MFIRLKLKTHATTAVLLRRLRAEADTLMCSEKIITDSHLSNEKVYSSARMLLGWTVTPQSLQHR
jgi:hypothetical protein